MTFFWRYVCLFPSLTPYRASYDWEAYNSLPGLSLASRSFQDTNAKAIIDGPIRDLFLSHRVHEEYGIALLHRHFPMEESKRLVEYHNVSTPWETGGDTSVVTAKYDGFIVPRSFRYREDCFQPYEFGFSTTNSSGTLNEQFTKDLALLLRRYGMDELLGLRVLEQRDSDLSLEVTEGNANIMVAAGALPTDSMIEALWIFGTDGNENSRCGEFCVGTSEGHSSTPGHGRR
jgi:hypothetical protein